MKETLCWSCANPGTGRCSWDENLTPVFGWIAVKTKTDGFDTFRVAKCPMFIQEQARRIGVPRLVRRRNPDGKGRVLLTDALIQTFDNMGLSLKEVSAITGVKSGVIYQRRLKLRRNAGRESESDI